MGLDKIFKVLVPKDNTFYPLFNKDADNLIEIADTLLKMLKSCDLAERAALIKRIKELEVIGDDITHEIFENLSRSFITPFDREVINNLASKIDDVADYINGVGMRISLYKPKNFIPEFSKMAEDIYMAVEEIHKAVLQLNNLKDPSQIIEASIKINQFENQCDEIYHNGVSALFEYEKDPVELIKKKEILETLEKVADKAEDVADVLKSIVIKIA